MTSSERSKLNVPNNPSTASNNSGGTVTYTDRARTDTRKPNHKWTVDAVVVSAVTRQPLVGRAPAVSVSVSVSVSAATSTAVPAPDATFRCRTEASGRTTRWAGATCSVTTVK